jgi:flagellar biosynthesis/type III secretory pathway protein FliH
VRRADGAARAARWTLEELAPASLEEAIPPSDERTAAELAQEHARREAAERERRAAEAYARGYEEGRLAGEIAEQARLRHAVHAAERALDELREGEEQWTGRIEENVCALAVAVARHIIGREVRADAEAVADVVRRALQEFPIDQPLRIRVHPADLALLATCLSADGTPIAIAPGRDARWLADALILPGGCLIEGQDRIVDGRVDTALERVYRRLTYRDA